MAPALARKAVAAADTAPAEARAELVGLVAESHARPGPTVNRPGRDLGTAASVKPPPRRLHRTILLCTSTRGAMSKPTARHSTRQILVRSIASCRGASR